MTATVASPHTPASTWTCTTASACASAREGARTAGAMPEGGGEGGSFMDFLGNLVDIVNPLQHIPVVSSIYRRVTGDQISGPAMIAGGALFGGPLGGAAAVANVAIAQESGGYAGDRMLASMLGDTPATTAPAASATLLASADGHAAPQAANGKVTLASSSGDSFFVSSNSASFQTPSLSASPTPNRTRTASGETATSRAPDTPVIRQLDTENVSATVRHSGSPASSQRLTAMAMDAGSSSLPEAPADSRMEIPPELMALKMKEGLDKYAAMKSRGL